MIIRKAILNSILEYKRNKKKILGTKPKRNKLIYHLPRSYGRNNHGVITVRHKARGVKRLYREINFLRNKLNIEGTVENIEYDPNRNAFLSLVRFPDNTIEYNIHQEGVKIGHKVISSHKPVSLNPGNATLLSNIPQGSLVSCISIRPNQRAKLARAAGTYAIIMEHTKDHCFIKMPKSGFVLRLNNNCMAVIGPVSNMQYQNKMSYKAGQSVLRGIRPTVRGVAMNPIDHPHGGGEGRGSVKRHPVSYTCKPAKGGKTAKARSRKNKSIIKRRTRKVK